MAETGAENRTFSYRARLTKGESLRYISHLDYAALVQRAIRRALLPAAYSEGFNPHMKMNFASALAVGTTSGAEYMDFSLTEALSAEEVAARLQAALPAGVEIVSLTALADRSKALMALVDEAVYEIEAPCAAASVPAAQSAVAAFNAAASCLYLRRTPKKTREIEARGLVLGAVRAAWADGRLKLTAAVRVAPDGSLKPQELLRLLCEKFSLPVRADEALCYRAALLSRGRALDERAETAS